MNEVRWHDQIEHSHGDGRMSQHSVFRKPFRNLATTKTLVAESFLIIFCSPRVGKVQCFVIFFFVDHVITLVHSCFIQDRNDLQGFCRVISLFIRLEQIIM